MRFKILLFLLAPVVWAGCNVINPVEDIPTYIKIDSFNFKINEPGKEGSAAHGISSVWIYYNNNPVGAFDLPCKVPVITQGDKGTISVIPGIRLNGLVSLQPQYVFYRFDTTTLVTNPGKVQDYTPTASYLDIAKFPFKEDFEIGNSFNQRYPELVEDTSIRRTTDKQYVFEGGGSGLIELSDAFPVSESISNTGFPIPQGESFIEINYKGSVDFEVGLYNTVESGIDVAQYIWAVKASDTWKKIYIELASFTGANKGKDHKVMIKAVLPAGQSAGYVSIDNIKVVTY
jgi:hypothetical protein